jgi:molecular chaperone DnaK (HSP70)
LFLRGFEISGIPKKKAGEAKIKIQLYIKEDSLLKIDAFDLSNSNNNEIKTLSLRMAKGKGLIDIICKLKKEQEEKIFLDIDYLMEMTINKFQMKKNINI